MQWCNQELLQPEACRQQAAYQDWRTNLETALAYINFSFGFNFKNKRSVTKSTL